MKRLLVVCLFLLMSAPVFAGMLQPGQGLSPGEKIYSNNGNYFATMQSDGNFVVYTSTGKALWSTNTTGLGANWAVMQSDGNFVLYNSSTGRAVWSSNTTYNMPGFAAITDYGQWIVFEVIPVWSSNTSDLSNPVGANAAIIADGTYLTKGVSYTAGKYRFTFQYDGNAVIYNQSGAIWSTGTANKNDYAYVTNGFLIVDKVNHLISNQDPPMFQSGMNVPTSQFSMMEWNSSYLALQADGNLVMYIPKRVFKSYSPYAPPATSNVADGPNCYGPPDACFGGTLPIYKYTW